MRLPSLRPPLDWVFGGSTVRISLISSAAKANFVSKTDRSLVSEFADALKQCGHDKALHHGRKIHSDIIARYGHDPPLFLGNILVEVYGLCGSTMDAQRTFDRIQKRTQMSWTILIKAYSRNRQLERAQTVFRALPNPDVISWNTMIAAYSQNRHGGEAISLFLQMLGNGCKPSNVTFVCILDTCNSAESCYLIHHAILDFQLEKDVTVGNALITMYGKFGSVDDSRGNFRCMIVRNVVTWSALVAVHVQSTLTNEALDIFHNMLQTNLYPNNITCVSALDACGTVGDMLEGYVIYGLIAECGYDKNVPICNALISMFGKCGGLSEAVNVLERMDVPNVVSWTALMGAYAQKGYNLEVMHLFHLLQLDAIKPDKVVYLGVLDTCAELGNLLAGQEVHAAIVESGFDHEIVLCNSLINFYGKCGILSHARNVFMGLSSGNVISWSTMIITCAQNEHGTEALDLYFKMQDNGIEPNAITLVSVLEACTSLTDGQILHFAMTCSKCEKNATVATALVNMYDAYGSFHDAKTTFDGVLEKDVILWTSIIATSSHTDHHEEALHLFYQMQIDGFNPNTVTFVCVLEACSSLAMLEVGEETHNAVLNCEIDDTGVVINALISMYAKCGNVYDAISHFSLMHHSDLISWNAVLSACAQNGQANHAFDLFRQMKLRKIELDGVTFIGLLTACSHAGLIEYGIQHFLSLIMCYQSLVTEEHFAIMIDLLGRAGQLLESQRLLLCMPFVGMSSALSSLLGACRNHMDVERAVSIANVMLDLNPQQISCYVDLSNILAAVDS